MGLLSMLLFVLVVTPALGAETARQILDRREALEKGAQHWDDRQQKLTFVIHSSGADRQRELDLYEKRYGDDERKSIVFFASP